MRDIVAFIKDKDLDLYEKIREIKSLVSKKFEDKQGDTLKADDKPSKFVRLFTMNERQ